MSNPTTIDQRRRELLHWMWRGGAAIGGLTCGGLALGSVRFLLPNVSYAPPSRFKIGPAARFPRGEMKLLADHRIFVFNGAEGFFALSAVCTHLGCTVRHTGAGFSCPCHGSVFDPAGRVLSGPAPRPLDFLLLSRTRSGDLVVDTREPVDPARRLRI